jgi:predicted Rossmann-fold nucleotide-binding protein
MEIQTLDALAALLSDQHHSLARVSLQDLDLSGSPELVSRLAAADPRGLVVLGGDYPGQLLRVLIAGGATVLPKVPGVPFDPYRSRLYSGAELYAGLDAGYEATVDARCYRWYGRGHDSPDVVGATFSAIHDASITDALAELLAADRRPVVAVMGGHGIHRGDDGYRAAARIGSLLARSGVLVATGGGPGAMEAVNLGAAFADRLDAELDAAVGRLATVNSFADIGAWARVALTVADENTREKVCSIGIPTWFYGHEPPNVFGDRIAKYFSNAIREDILLAKATGGVLVLPGAAGTVQEIFQAAARAYYSAEPTPIVLVGTRYWQQQLPAWPLLHALAADRPMAGRVAICETAEDALSHLALTRV